MTARADLLDEYGRANTAPLGTMSDLTVKFNAVRAEVESAVRAEIAADFEQFGKRKDALTWGEAVLIVREGLCKCRGGSKPCETAVTS